MRGWRSYEKHLNYDSGVFQIILYRKLRSSLHEKYFSMLLPNRYLAPVYRHLISIQLACNFIYSPVVPSSQRSSITRGNEKYDTYWHVSQLWSGNIENFAICQVRRVLLEKLKNAKVVLVEKELYFHSLLPMLRNYQNIDTIYPREQSFLLFPGTTILMSFQK